MSTTLAEIEGFLTKAGLHFKSEAGRNRIVLGFVTEHYRDREGDLHLPVGISLDEDGEYVAFLSPNVYTCPADNPHRAAVLEACLRVHWRCKLICFEYDHNDGEVRATVRLPLEDSGITERQFMRCLMALPSLIDKHDHWFRAALDTGTLPDTTDEQIEDLERRLEGLRQRKAVGATAKPSSGPDVGLEE